MWKKHKQLKDLKRGDIIMIDEYERIFDTIIDDKVLVVELYDEALFEQGYQYDVAYYDIENIQKV